MNRTKIPRWKYEDHTESSFAEHIKVLEYTVFLQICKWLLLGGGLNFPRMISRCVVALMHLAFYPMTTGNEKYS